MNFNLNKSVSSNNNIKFYTGLTSVKVLGVNPTHEQLKEITGNENIPASFCNYQERTNQFAQIQEFPITIWFKAGDSVFPQTINVGREKAMSKNGKFKIINNYGKISSFISSIEELQNNPKMQWFSTTSWKPLLVGEEMLYTLMKQLYKYDEGSEGWLDNMVTNNIVADKLFNGQGIDALRTFLLEYCKDQEIIMLLTVKKRILEDNKEKLQQELVMNSDLIFRTVTGQVTDTMLDKVKTVDNDLQTRTGKFISKNEYTYDFQEFNSDNSVNKAPDSVSGSVFDFLN